MIKYIFGGILPIICGLLYNSITNSGILLLIFGVCFPFVWGIVAYRIYTIPESKLTTLFKLHIPILICFLLSSIQIFNFNCYPYFKELNNIVTSIEGPLAQKAFLPMAFCASPFGSIFSFSPNNEKFYLFFLYITSIIQMFCISYVGCITKQKECESLYLNASIDNSENKTIPPKE